MTRKLALDVLRVALLQGDEQKAIRTYVENNISMRVFAEYRQKYFKVAV